MGNCEVGHLNLGAGAVVKQDLTRIDEAVEDGTLADNEVLRAALRRRERVHLIGLGQRRRRALEHATHLRALIALGAQLGVPTRGPRVHRRPRHLPTSGAELPRDVEAWCAEAGNARVGSVVGRYFAMDRDQRWDRTQRATTCSSTAAARTTSAGRRTRVARPTSATRDRRVHRADARRRRGADPPAGLRHLLQLPARPHAPARRCSELGAARSRRYTTLTEYEEGWDLPVAFPPARPAITLPQVIAATGGRQLHVAETEKYPHVTYFFGGGEEDPAGGERRELVPSPRDVPTYDHKPEMSAREAADAFVARLARGRASASGSSTSPTPTWSATRA